MSYFSVGKKRSHLRTGEVSLEVRCLRDGSLDVDLDSGRVFSTINGKTRERKLIADKDGYLRFLLNRERSQKRGKPQRDGKKLRYRKSRQVLVNRLVKIKALAVAKGGANWRLYVADLPRGVDVNHLGPRDDNRSHQLELQTERANRSKKAMTAEEFARIAEVF